MRKLVVAAGIAAILLSGPTVAQAQQVDQTLMYEMLSRLEQLEDELRQVRGQVEELRYRLDQTAGGRTSNAPARVPDSRVSIDANGPLAPMLDSNLQPRDAAGKQVYDQALAQLRSGNYEQATQGFDEMLRQSPNGPLAGNAQYWLGESLYVQRNLPEARDAFLKLATDYPDSSKVPDGLLKLAYTFQAMNEISKAKLVLNELISSWPQSNAARLAETRLSQL